MLSLLSLFSVASAAAPELKFLFPGGGQRGTTVSVKATGKFDWPVGVRCGGADVVCAEETGELQISIPDDLPSDRIWLRLHNEQGASNMVPFEVGQLPEMREQEPNNSPRTAQTLESPNVTVNGVLHQRAEVDAFAINLNQGETLTAAVAANHRLGSPMDAILQLTTRDGTVLAENHDTVGLDPRLQFTVRRTDAYVVRIFAFSSTPNTTIALQGGADYVYRLTLTTGPFVTHALPMTVPADYPGQHHCQWMAWTVEHAA